MNIAFISHEYPTETGGGGIGTYLSTIVPCLRHKGHNAIVFAGTYAKNAFWESNFIYRIPCSNIDEFNINVVHYFEKVHKELEFDIIEGTDFKGWGLHVKNRYPQIPFVIKLHTPSYLIDKLHFKPLALLSKVRYFLGAVKRLKLPKFPRIESKNYQEELDALKLADVYHCPSKSIYNKLRDLNLLDKQTSAEVFPYPIKLDEEVLKINARTKCDPLEVVFLGRMEVRKGVVELANAIPMILKKHPFTKFTFVGNPVDSPKKGVNMLAYLENKIASFSESVTFTGKVPHSEISNYLKKGDVFIFPSHYESFGIVCTEAMLAGKAVIGSLHGGMEEILDYGNCGLLTDGSPKDISKNIIRLIEDSNLRLDLGKKARKRILDFYATEIVAEKQLEFYKKVVKQHK